MQHGSALQNKMHEYPAHGALESMRSGTVNAGFCG